MTSPRIATVAALLVALTACGAGGSDTPRSLELSDRELAWCLSKPGAIGSLATDTGVAIPAEAEAAVDDGMANDAARWRYHDAWLPSTYAHLCLQAYDQFGGAATEVDTGILEASARIPTPSPTANLTRVGLRERAYEFVPELEAAGATLLTAIEGGDPRAMRDAADLVSDITGAETDALFGAVAEPCYADAGAAYGMTIFNWGVAAGNVLRYLDEQNDGALALAVDFAGDAIDSASEWRRLDETAC